MMNNYELIDDVASLEMAARNFTKYRAASDVFHGHCEFSQIPYYSVALIRETCRAIRQLYETDSCIDEFALLPEDFILGIMSKAADAVETASE